MRNRFQTREKMEFDLCYLQRYEKCTVRFLIGLDTITFTFKIRFVPFFLARRKVCLSSQFSTG